MEDKEKLCAIAKDFDSTLEMLIEIIEHIESSTKERRHLKVQMLNSTMVTLTSSIEEVFRSLFRGYLEVLEVNIQDYEFLPDKLKSTNLICLGKAIQRHAKGYYKSHDKEDKATLMRHIDEAKGCLAANAKYKILTESVIYNDGNYRSQQLTEISTGIGIPESWHHICSCSEIEELTNESEIERRKTIVINKWNELFSERDQIVHWASRANGWSSDKIIDFIPFLKIVVNRFAEHLRDNAEKHIEHAKEENTKKHRHGLN